MNTTPRVIRETPATLAIDLHYDALVAAALERQRQNRPAVKVTKPRDYLSRSERKALEMEAI